MRPDGGRSPPHYNRRNTQTWSLADDVAGNVLAGNPHPIPQDGASGISIRSPSHAEGTDTFFPPDRFWRAGSPRNREPRNNSLRNNSNAS